MPIAKLDAFREDVRQFLKMSTDIQTNIIREYMTNRAPEIVTTLSKAVENNEKFFKGELTLNDVWTVITREEMLALARSIAAAVEEHFSIRLEMEPERVGF